MKFHGFLALSLAGFGLSAHAADAPAPGPAATLRAPAAVMNWTGFYLGGQAGFGRDRFVANDRNWDGGFTNNSRWLDARFKLDSNGFLGGFQGGYQRQYGNFVAGLDIAGLSGFRKTIVSPYYPRTDQESGKVPLLVTGGLRLGYALDKVLIYAKAGYAGGSVKFTAYDRSTPAFFRHEAWQHGWMAGAGVEYALSANWTVGLDFTHADLGSKTKSGLTVPRQGKEIYRTSVEVQTVMLRVNYLFAGSAAPVIAKY